MSEEIAFSLTLGEDDLVHAFRLNARLGRTRPLFLAIALLVALLALILWQSPQARASASGRPLILLLEGAVGILGLLVGLLYASTPWLFRWGARRNLAQRKDLAGPVEYRVTPVEIVRSCEGSLSRERLAHLRHWREDDRAMLLYLPSGLFYVLPKSQVSDKKLAVLREWLAAAGVMAG